METGTITAIARKKAYPSKPNNAVTAASTIVTVADNSLRSHMALMLRTQLSESPAEQHRQRTEEHPFTPAVNLQLEAEHRRKAQGGLAKNSSL